MSVEESSNSNKDISVVIVSGVSGSGKSTALNVLKDIGFSGVDNLPEDLLPFYGEYVVNELLSISPESKNNLNTKFALLVNFSDKEGFSHLDKTLDTFQKNNIKIALIYLDAQNYVLKRRFKETRRPHPFWVKEKIPSSLQDSLDLEREFLSSFRSKSDKVFDTSSFTPHDLKRNIEEFFSHERTLNVQVSSFGFKYGPPQDADLMVDVRFLPNPHFVPDLRQKTGLDKEVSEYVFCNEDADKFLEIYDQLLDFLLPRYQNEGKHSLNIAIGCTGGKHRSVALTEKVASKLISQGIMCEIYHRDLAKVS